MSAIKHAFSVDLEDWCQGIELPMTRWENMEYRLENGLDVILSILDETCIKCTFFCLGWIAKQYPQIIKKLSDEGHEIGSHGFCHEKVYDMTQKTFREEMEMTKKLLEDITGTSVLGHRSPFFSITRKSLWALQVLKEVGFEYDCSISPIETWRYGISSSPDYLYKIKEVDIIEYPVSNFSLFGKKMGVGGAYFRIFPYFYFKKLFQNRSQTGQPGMLYVHPWEYDPEHPVIDFHWRAKLTHYYNLKGMKKRTEKLLRSFSFTTVKDVIETTVSNGKIPEISVKQLER
jgi:polysaccharide deacetylase family protein (PEP-CTERM system associated)